MVKKLLNLGIGGGLFFGFLMLISRLVDKVDLSILSWFWDVAITFLIFGAIWQAIEYMWGPENREEKIVEYINTPKEETNVDKFFTVLVGGSMWIFTYVIAIATIVLAGILIFAVAKAIIESGAWIFLAGFIALCLTAVGLDKLKKTKIA